MTISIKRLIIENHITTLSMITAWGLANYFKGSDFIVFNFTVFGKRIKITMDDFQYTIATLTFYIVGGKSCYLLNSPEMQKD